MKKNDLHSEILFLKCKTEIMKNLVSENKYKMICHYLLQPMTIFNRRTCKHRIGSNQKCFCLFCLI